MDYPIVEEGYYFLVLYKKSERLIDGEIQIGKYAEGYWKLMGHDVGIPMDSLLEVIGEKIELPIMKF